MTEASKEFRAAFDGIEQIDGPPMAYYEVTDTDGAVTRYVYQTFGWQSDDPTKIVTRFNGLAQTIRDSGQSIVWRRHPALVAKDPEGGKFYASCRFHVLPYVKLSGEKLEGEEMDEA